MTSFAELAFSNALSFAKAQDQGKSRIARLHKHVPKIPVHWAVHTWSLVRTLITAASWESYFLYYIPPPPPPPSLPSLTQLHNITVCATENIDPRHVHRAQSKSDWNWCDTPSSFIIATHLPCYEQSLFPVVFLFIFSPICLSPSLCFSHFLHPAEVSKHE